MLINNILAVNLAHTTTRFNDIRSDGRPTVIERYRAGC